MKNKLSHLFITFIILCICSSGFAQTGWHTDPYPIQENIDVLHYKFDLRIEDNTDNIKGKAAIRFRITAPEKQLFLDLTSLDTAGGMNVRKVEMDGMDLNFKHENNRVSIDCPSFSGKDDIMEVTVYYSGTPRDGLIISQNKFDQRSFFGDNWPNRAHHWLPTVDHPSDKATVEFIVTAPDHYQVIANGEQLEETNLDDNYAYALEGKCSFTN